MSKIGIYHTQTLMLQLLNEYCEKKFDQPSAPEVLALFETIVPSNLVGVLATFDFATSKKVCSF